MSDRKNRQRLLLGALAGLGAVLALALLNRNREKPISSRVDDLRGVGPSGSYESGPTRQISPSTSPPRFVASPSDKPPAREPTAVLALRKHAQSGMGPGKRILTPARLYPDEPRDPAWATAMENELRKRLNGDSFKALGLASVEVDDLDCRSSSCKVTVSWDSIEQEALKGLSPNPDYRLTSPLDLLLVATGPLGTMNQAIPPAGQRWPRGGAFILPNGRMSTAMVFLFGEENIDPDGYAAWVTRLHAGNQERMKASKGWGK